MRVGGKRIWIAGLSVVLSPFVLASLAQEPAGAEPEGSVKVVQITGLTGIKKNTGGTLVVESGSLRFSHAAMKTEVPTASMEDVITGADSQRVIHGTLGSIGLLAAPYGSGRFLSLFRSKLDTLTLKYRDADGGLHGVIFTMPLGKAEVIKKQLLAQGARTTVPEEAANASPQSPTAKEQKQ
jgi:hypothetical protein